MALGLEVWLPAVPDVIRLVTVVEDNVKMLGCVLEGTTRSNRICCKLRGMHYHVVHNNKNKNKNKNNTFIT